MQSIVKRHTTTHLFRHIVQKQPFEKNVHHRLIEVFKKRSNKRVQELP